MTAGKKKVAKDSIQEEFRFLEGKLGGALTDVTRNRTEVAEAKKELEAARRHLDEVTMHGLKSALDELPPERMYLPGTQTPISESLLMQILHTSLYQDAKWQKAQERYINAQNVLVDADTKMLNAGDTLGVVSQRARLFTAFMNLSAGGQS